jgi:membrane protein DedA with SNARE-associated domain
MGLTEFIATYATAFIAHSGYGGVYVLMAMESMVFPVPSEAVMPFAGFLVAEGRLSFTLVLLFSTLGSITGSLLSYWIGRYGGHPFVERYGRYLLLDREDLEKTTDFFQRYGDATIFVSRFIPVVRHLISIPAGAGGMGLFKFSVYTVLGAGIWNVFLTVCGFYLRQNWETVMAYSKLVDIAVLVILLGAGYYFVVKHLQRRRAAAR